MEKEFDRVKQSNKIEHTKNNKTIKHSQALISELVVIIKMTWKSITSLSRLKLIW